MNKYVFGLIGAIICMAFIASSCQERDAVSWGVAAGANACDELAARLVKGSFLLLTVFKPPCPRACLKSLLLSRSLRSE